MAAPPTPRSSAPAIASRISRELFLADLDLHQRRLGAEVAPDFAETLYASAIWRA